MTVDLTSDEQQEYITYDIKEKVIYLSTTRIASFNQCKKVLEKYNIPYTEEVNDIFYSLTFDAYFYRGLASCIKKVRKPIQE